MLRSRALDGFALAYVREGDGDPVILLHGWPGDHGDWQDVIGLLSDHAEVIAPDLRGFGMSDKHPAEPARAYSAQAQAASVLALIDELGVARPVLAGYDVGSRVARHIAAIRPQQLRGLVLAPPLPGAGSRVLTPQAQEEFWYQAFHRLALAEDLIDGNQAAVRAYLTHFWSHWSGPHHRIAEDHLDRLVSLYSPPGAFVASIGWYRAGSAAVATALGEQAPAPARRMAIPTTILWPEHDPLFPVTWSDRIGEFFSAASTEILSGVGHFSPVEAPDAWARAILDLVASASESTQGH